MTTDLEVRVSEAEVAAVVPGAWELRLGNLVVMEPAAGKRRAKARAVGKRIPEMTPNELRGDGARLTEVVPFGRDHLDADAAAALLAYFTWRSLAKTRPMLHALFGDDTYRYRLWVPWWDLLPRTDRDAFVRAMTHASRLRDLWVNDSQLLRQTTLRRLLGRRPVLVEET